MLFLSDIQAEAVPGESLPKINDRPMIGLLTQPLLEEDKKDPRFKGYHSFIMKTYVTFLEASGARVVPLIFGNDFEQEAAKLTHLNGVFYAGGRAPTEYQQFARQIFDRVKAFNDAG